MEIYYTCLSCGLIQKIIVILCAHWIRKRGVKYIFDIDCYLAVLQMQIQTVFDLVEYSNLYIMWLFSIWDFKFGINFYLTSPINLSINRFSLLLQKCMKALSSKFMQ